MPTNPLNDHALETDFTNENAQQPSFPQVGDGGSDYGDFGSDAEELAIVEHLLQQIDTRPDGPDSLIITDIEDYEPPHGLRLPKVLGRETTRQWESISSQDQLQIIRDLEAHSGEWLYPVFCARH